jgi:hypothetical protein
LKVLVDAGDTTHHQESIDAFSNLEHDLIIGAGIKYLDDFTMASATQQMDQYSKDKGLGAK